MRDFKWTDNLWCVVKADGTFAGTPCKSYDEAWELALQHKGSATFKLEVEEIMEKVLTKKR